METHIGHEEKHGEIPPDDEKGAFHDGGRCADQVRYHDEGPIYPADAIGDLTPEQTDRLTGFFNRWLAMSPTARDSVAGALAHEPLAVTAERRACSEQNIHKAAKRAARRMPELGAALGVSFTPRHRFPLSELSKDRFALTPSSPISTSEKSTYTT